MEQPFTLISIGNRLPGWEEPVREGLEFNIDRGGCRVKIGYNYPTKDEIKAFQKSPIKIGILRGGLHTTFLMFRIDGLIHGWSDATFALGLVDPDYRRIDNRAPDEGWLISFIMFDSRSGYVTGLRMGTVTPDFSNVLDGLVAEQRQHLNDFSIERHQAEIANCYEKWITPAHMIKDSLITETIGIQFQKFSSRQQKHRS